MILEAVLAVALAAEPVGAAPEPAQTSTSASTSPPAAEPAEATSATAAPAAPRKVGGFLPPAVVMPAGAPRRVVLLLADGTPGKDDAGYAQALAADGALVAVLDTRAWLEVRGKAPRCAYPAGDLEVLAQQVEKERGLDAYERPVVVGLGQGAEVAWAAIAQGPAGTFSGAVLASPCPERPLPVKLCAVEGPRPRRLAGGDLPALAKVHAPAEVLADRGGACPVAHATRLATAIGARLGTIARPAGPAGGADPSVAAAVRAAVERLPSAAPAAGSPATAASTAASTAEPASVADLPVVEVPARGGDPRFAVLITGDGGWVGIDKSIAAALGDAGVATVGLDALKYFWKKRSPEETADAIARIIRHYAAAWNRPEVILVGYSRGADLSPFIAARLGPAERARVRLVALLGPGTFAEFEVHAIDIFSNVRRDSALGTEDPLRATAGRTRFLCVRGSEEKDSLCPHVEDLPWVKQVVLTGGHHFDGDYKGIARMILDAAGP